ncbi:MAG: sigma-70 family RNA polymerase sigma factor [Myxococcales bacterium]|nr:sigma-70 family RNA polymerase sigma factor [Myxococcales bacterium]
MPPTPFHGDAPDAERALGDRELAELYARTFRGMSAWLAGRTRETADAEDLAQETFLRAMQTADAYRGDSSPESWVFGIARNVLRHHYRSRRARKRGGDLVRVGFDDEVERAGLVTPFDEVHARLDLDDLSGRVRAAVGEADWQLLAAHHVEDEPIEALAARTACSSSAIKSRLHRARARLEPLLREAAF